MQLGVFCEEQQQRPAAPWFTDRLPLPVFLPSRQVSAHPQCRVKLTVLDESSGKGKAAGHKVKLTAALVLSGSSNEGLAQPGRSVRCTLCVRSADGMG